MVELSANALLTGAEIVSNQGAINKNVAAVKYIYDSIKTSYGPLGLDKMCIDATGEVLITNDGATILENMLVENPTAKMLVSLSLEQDKEVGDGTTSVVLLAASLVMKGAELIENGVHPSTVVSGYRIAFNESMKYIKQKVAKTVSKVVETSVVDSIIETAISSKIINQEKKKFIEILKKSIQNAKEGDKYMIDKISILKTLGGSMKDSEYFNGFILNCSVASRLMRKHIEKPVIACLDFSLLKEKLPLTVSINVTDPTKLEAIRIQEIEMTKKKCRAIIESGANLVLTTGGIDEMCIKMFVDNNIVAVRRCTIEDLEHIAKATGTTVLKSMFDFENNYEIKNLGSCDNFYIKSLSDYDLVYLEGCINNISTILLKGPNTQVVDEARRACNDALQVLKKTLESKSIVPGGGAVEAALMFLLEDFAANINTKEYAAINRYAEALLEIPRILASNAGLDSNKIVGKLLKKQYEIYKSGQLYKFYGLDVMKGAIQDNLESGIVEPTIYKLKVFKAATEAAIGILRINEISVFPSENIK